MVEPANPPECGDRCKPAGPLLDRSCTSTARRVRAAERPHLALLERAQERRRGISRDLPGHAPLRRALRLTEQQRRQCHAERRYQRSKPLPEGSPRLEAKMFHQ